VLADLITPLSKSISKLAFFYTESFETGTESLPVPISKLKKLRGLVQNWSDVI
jgi:hypothetical protein